MTPARHLLRLLAAVLLLASAAGTPVRAGEPFDSWRAGTAVTAAQIAAQGGADACFAAERVGEALLARISGRSYKAGCPLPVSELRYLKVLHYGLDGKVRLGEMLCNRAIAADLLEIFRALYDARYPIERMVLIDDYEADDNRSMEANNSSSFNYRTVSGRTTLSRHATGMAVDINPLYNPYIYTRNGRTVVEPASGLPYADRTGDFPCKIDAEDLCCRLFKAHGFRWGGDWKSVKDYQHFEK